MVDVVSKRKRSEMMAAVRAHGNRTTEQALKCIFRTHGITGWRSQHIISLNAASGSAGRTSRSAAVRPDFAFRSKRVVVFVDGCFWHRCPRHYRTPKTNRRFWDTKTRLNKARDIRVHRALRNLGWRVIRLWEHEIRLSPDMCAEVVRAALKSHAMKPMERGDGSSHVLGQRKGASP
jgi:DNA mismatch endonuclease (patch repair protein)